MATEQTENRPAPDRWALLLPGWFPPSLNSVAMAHWSEVRKHKRAALDHLIIFGQRAGGLPRFEGPVKVSITRLIGYRQRAMDTENLYGAVKPLIDAMRAEKAGRNQRGRNRHGGVGIFKDDNPRDLDLEVDQRKHADAETIGWMQGLGLVPEDTNQTGTVIIVEGRRVA